MIERPMIEFNVVEHCNLRCHACDHGAPLTPPRFASPARFADDVSRLSRVMHVGELRLLGGEPLLHPKLFEFADMARHAGLADKIVLVTNGVLLHRMPVEVWSRIDRLWLSQYPGAASPTTRERAAELCREHGVEFHLDVKDEMFLTLLNQPIESPELVETIFLQCKSAHEWCCHTLHEGRYTKCPTAALLPERLRRMGVRFEAEPRDSVLLDQPDLAARLETYLAEERPLAACAWCLGSSGPPLPSRQLDQAGLAAWAREDHRDVVRLVAAMLARDPGGRPARLTAPLPLMDKPRTPWIAPAVSAARRLVTVAQDNCWAKRLRQRFTPAGRQESPQPTVKEQGAPSGASYRAALGWLRERVKSCSLAAGELGDAISTLLDCGEPRLALQLGEQLCRVQRPDGSWATDESSVLATSRAVIGLSALQLRLPGVAPALRRGCAWLLDHAGSGSCLSLPALIGRASNEQARLWTTAALARGQARPDEWRPDLQSAVLLGDEPWRSWVHSHATAPGLLLDLGRRDEVAAWAAHQQELQRSDGSLPAFSGASWTCPTCTALTAAVFCRLGRLAPAHQALAYLESVQHASGGFPGSQGAGASFRPADSLLHGAWAYLDAFHLFLQASFDEQVEDFSDEVEADDGRLEVLWREAGDLNGKRVLDAGCGRGCIARALASRFPAADIWGTDHSELMLSHLPAGMSRRRGSIQNLPFADGDFDLVICVEAIEHAGNPPGAVAELCRVTRPGGRVVIVDKNLERVGALAVESWEQWFSRAEVEDWLRPFCAEVQVHTLRHAPHLGAGLFLTWCGRRSTEAAR